MRLRVKNLNLNLHFRVYFKRTHKRTGIHSINFEDRKSHILLWDFDDNGSFGDIIKDLQIIQEVYLLPDIYIIKSSPKKFHAYCFAKRNFKQVLHILSASKYIDDLFLRLGCARGYFTLRISKRTYNDLKLVARLDGFVPDEMSPLDISAGEFYTTNGGDKNA